MKIDRHKRIVPLTRVKLVVPLPISRRLVVPSEKHNARITRYCQSIPTPSRWLVVICLLAPVANPSCGQDQRGLNATAEIGQEASSVSRQQPEPTADKDTPISQPQAERLLEQVLDRVVHGPSFDAKVRETVWTSGRMVVGVGTYEQAGKGSGKFNLQLTMHDGDGKHRLQQISDGRLAWTRSEIAGKVSLRRVDVGRLEQWVRGTTGGMRISPRLRVGAWAEMLSKIQRDYYVRVDVAFLEDEPVWVITANLKQDRRAQILADSGREEWPPLHPTQVLVAVKSKGQGKAGGFGQLLPVRFEFRSDPVESDAEQSESTHRRGPTDCID